MEIYDLDATTITSLRDCLPMVLKHYKNTPIITGKTKYLVCCPTHNDRNPSCQVNTKKGVYHCFSCGASGDVFTIVAQEESLKLTDWRDFQKAAKIIAEIGGVNLKVKEKEKEKKDGEQNKSLTNLTIPREQSTITELPPVFIPMEEVKGAAGRVEQTTLYKYLCRLLSSDEVRNVCNAYLVGATSEFGSIPGYASAFPYINIKGECVDVHLQPYEEDGHRWKHERHPYFQNWRLAKLKQNDRRAPWPLFGEHLLPSRPSAPVGIVESEKTALIASILAPGYVWTATASLANLNARRLAAVKDRECYVFPDLDGLDKWREKTAALAKEGFKVFFCGQYIQENATPGSKEDLADILINFKLKSSTNE